MSESSQAIPLLHPSRRPFLLRKLHSLSGVVPIGMFLLVHLWTNSKALQGQARFDAAVAEITHTPYLPLVELLGILGPLAFHALYGVKIALESRSNVRLYPTTRNWMHTLQRVTGFIALAFIAWHLWDYWAQKVLGRLAPENFYSALAANLSSTWHGVPVTALGYLLGLAAACFHFSNGLWGFCFSWGITVSKRAQQRGALIFGIFGLALFAMGANTVIYFATGSRLAMLGGAGGEADLTLCTADLSGRSGLAVSHFSAP